MWCSLRSLRKLKIECHRLNTDFTWSYHIYILYAIIMFSLVSHKSMVITLDFITLKTVSKPFNAVPIKTWVKWHFGTPYMMLLSNETNDPHTVKSLLKTSTWSYIAYWEEKAAYFYSPQSPIIYKCFDNHACKQER